MLQYVPDGNLFEIELYNNIKRRVYKRNKDSGTLVPLRITKSALHIQETEHTRPPIITSFDCEHYPPLNANFLSL